MVVVAKLNLGTTASGAKRPFANLSISEKYHFRKQQCIDACTVQRDDRVHLTGAGEHINDQFYPDGREHRCRGLFIEPRTLPRTSIPMKDLISAAILAGLTASPASPSEDNLRVTNVIVHMVRYGSGVPHIEGWIINPNTFAVYDIVADCEFKDRRGNALTSFQVTISDAVQPNGARTIRGLVMEQWPQKARAADCVSVDAKPLPE
jgi:hypothetical protein